MNLQKNVFTIVLLLLLSFFFSCTRRLEPGTYSYIDTTNHLFLIYSINIDNEHHYFFQRKGEGYKMFSQGRVLLNNEEVSFIPDSSLFFRINVLKYSYDASLGKRFKVILNTGNTDFQNVFYYCNNGSGDPNLKFTKDTIIFSPLIPNYQERGWIILKAKLTNADSIVPKPKYDSLLSNRINLYNVNDNDPDDKPWNVLELSLSIKYKMFEFTTIPTMILKRKALIQKSPVYSLDPPPISPHPWRVSSPDTTY